MQSTNEEYYAICHNVYVAYELGAGSWPEFFTLAGEITTHSLFYANIRELVMRDKTNVFMQTPEYAKLLYHGLSEMVRSCGTIKLHTAQDTYENYGHYLLVGTRYFNKSFVGQPVSLNSLHFRSLGR